MGFGNMLRGPWGGCGQHGGPFSKLILWRLNKKLNLTAEQRQELDALLLQLEEAYKAVEEVGVGLHMEFVELLSADQLDRAKMDRLIKAQFVAAADAVGEVSERLGDLFESLDIEQRGELVAMMQKHGRSHRCFH
ncbi:hypothetical protein BOW53_12635 [Solemya pervernicosa gill symbiont]|uniref:Uncharacterized protein n=2 Tax=Gammaproteobacteria incertae sedis TaxID=118884 RepID=A0A1T2L297_9GAMM|nr:Spy/CpxP family protein refolding chaperone [Solemya pervernicosa gill symbiont]OOZ39223.1 hypothetical protein BOW53_12635 [Solemya pervernicosa gill symbiont]